VANAIEIIDYGREGAEVDYGQKIQAFHRFLINSLNSEFNIYPQIISPEPVENSAPSPITRLLGINGKNVIKCSQCKNIREKSYSTRTLDMLYPLKVNHWRILPNFFAKFCEQTGDRPPLNFTELLKYSLFRSDTHKASCPHCRHFSTFTSTRSIASSQLPPILAVNSSIYNDETLSYWSDSRNPPFMHSQIPLHGEVHGVIDEEEVLYNVRVRLPSLILNVRPSWRIGLDCGDSG